MIRFMGLNIPAMGLDIPAEFLAAVMIVAAAASPAMAASGTGASSATPVDTVVVVGTPSQAPTPVTPPTAYHVPTSSVEPGQPSEQVQPAAPEGRRNGRMQGSTSTTTRSAPPMSSRNDSHKFPWLILALGLAGAAAFAATR